jgi:hypothetical protein
LLAVEFEHLLLDVNCLLQFHYGLCLGHLFEGRGLGLVGFLAGNYSKAFDLLLVGNYLFRHLKCGSFNRLFAFFITFLVTHPLFLLLVLLTAFLPELCVLLFLRLDLLLQLLNVPFLVPC